MKLKIKKDIGADGASDEDSTGSMFVPQDDDDLANVRRDPIPSIEKRVLGPSPVRNKSGNIASGAARSRVPSARSAAPGPQTPSIRESTSAPSSKKVTTPARANTSSKITPAKSATKAPAPPPKTSKPASENVFLRSLTDEQLLLGFSAEELMVIFDVETVINETYKREDILNAMTDSHVAKAAQAFKASLAPKIKKETAEIMAAPESVGKAKATKGSVNRAVKPKPKVVYNEFLHEGQPAVDLCTPEPEERITEHQPAGGPAIPEPALPETASNEMTSDVPTGSRGPSRQNSYPYSSIHWAEEDEQAARDELLAEAAGSADVDMTGADSPVIEAEAIQSLIEIADDGSDEDMPTIQDLTKARQVQAEVATSLTPVNEVSESPEVVQESAAAVADDVTMIDAAENQQSLSVLSIHAGMRALSVEPVARAMTPAGNAATESSDASENRETASVAVEATNSAQPMVDMRALSTEPVARAMAPAGILAIESTRHL